MSDEEISEKITVVKQLIHEKEMEIAQMEQRMLRKRASRTERLFAHLIDERSRENIEDSIDPEKDRSQESIEDLSELIKDDPDGSDSDVIDDHSSIGAGEISGILDVGDASTSPCPSPPPGDLPRREHGDRRRLSSAAKKAANSRPSPPRTSKRETFHKRPGQGTEEQSAHAKGHGNGRPTSAPSAASARHETARRQRPSSAHPLPGRKFRQMPKHPNEGSARPVDQPTPTPPCTSRETFRNRSRATPPVMPKSDGFQPKRLFEHDDEIRQSFHYKAKKSPLFPRPASAFVQRNKDPHENSRPPFVVMPSGERQRRPQSARSPSTGQFLRKGEGGRLLWQVREEKVAKIRAMTPRQGETQPEMVALDLVAQADTQERARAHVELLRIASERAARIQVWREEARAEKIELHRVWVEGQRRLMVRKRALDRAKKEEQAARDSHGVGSSQVGVGEVWSGQRKMLSIKVLWANLTPAALHHESPASQYMRVRVGGRDFRTDDADGGSCNPEWTATFHTALPQSHTEVEISWHVLLPGGEEQQRGRASTTLSGRMDVKGPGVVGGVVGGGREQSLTTLQLSSAREGELVGTCSLHFHFDRSVIPASLPERALSIAVAECEAALAAEEEEVQAMVEEAEKLVQRSQDHRWEQLRALHTRQQQLAQRVGSLSPRSGYAPPKPSTPSVTSTATSPQRRPVDEDAVAMAIRVYACPNHFVHWTPTTGEEAVSFHAHPPLPRSARSSRRTPNRTTRRRSPSHTTRQIGSCSTSPGKLGAVPPPSGEFDVPPVRSPREPNVIRTCWRLDQVSSREGSPTNAATSDSEDKEDFNLRFSVTTNHCYRPKPRDPADVLHAREGDRRRERLSRMAYQKREQDADVEVKVDGGGVKPTFSPMPNLLFPQPAGDAVTSKARRGAPPEGAAPTTPRRGRSAWPLGSPRARHGTPRGQRDSQAPQRQADQAS